MSVCGDAGVVMEGVVDVAGDLGGYIVVGLADQEVVNVRGEGEGRKGDRCGW